MQSPRAISLLFLFLLAGVSSFLYYPRYAMQKNMTAQLAALLSSSDNMPISLGSRSKSADCIDENASPDHACTPGAVFENATLKQICTPGYTKTVRNVSTKLKQTVYAEYNVSYPQIRGSYEVDHLIPLAIGGNNDIANLFPQPAEPAPGFKEKDLVEVYLHEEVCANRVVLNIAQRRIASDWLSIYQNLPLETVSRLKAEYRNWSN